MALFAANSFHSATISAIDTTFTDIWGQGVYESIDKKANDFVESIMASTLPIPYQLSSLGVGERQKPSRIDGE